MKFIPSLILASSLPSLALAQQIEPPTAWQAFESQNGQNWTTEWNPATGTPSAIYGPGLRLGKEIGNLATARSESAALLNRFASLLGRGESKFVETIGVKARMVYIFVYDQEYKGLPVISGRADVRINDVLFAEGEIVVVTDLMACRLTCLVEPQVEDEGNEEDESPT